MCGIAGIVGPQATRDRATRMSDALRHRGPDDAGLFCDGGIALAHRRLSILDLSPAGHQPMVSRDGRYQLVFNGEIFNYLEIGEQLGPLRSGSDSEVLLEAFAARGPTCLDDLVGMYAFAIWDTREKRLFCARDRLGIKPLYYARLGESWLFASEIGALLAAGHPASANRATLFDFLGRDFYEHTDDTFFAGVHKLPAGHWMWLTESSTPQITRYWDLASEVSRLEVPADRIERGDALLDRMRDAVRISLRSDVPVGITLSGGLDSAVLLSLVDEQRADRVAAFSFDFAEQEYSERPWVAAMATHTGHPVSYRTVTHDDFTATFDRIIRQQQEPHAGAPITAYTLCFELLRQSGVIVAMDGSGIDEGLAGYDRFRPALWADLAHEEKFDRLDEELTAAGTTREKAANAMRSAASVHGDVGKGQDLTSSVRPDCITAALTADAPAMPTFERPFPDALRNLMYRELRYTKLPRALRFRDRLSMAYGTELRPPFLDHRLLAFMFALPAEDRIAGGRTKALLRDAAARLLPDAVRLASKRSVQTPQREWFRGPLATWIAKELDELEFWSTGWVERAPALAALEQFQQGRGDNSFFIWQWLALARWNASFLESR